MQEYEGSGGSGVGDGRVFTQLKVDTNMIVTSMAHKRCDSNLFVIFSQALYKYSYLIYLIT